MSFLKGDFKFGFVELFEMGVACVRYVPSHRFAELPQRGSLGRLESTYRETEFLGFVTKGSPSGGAPAEGG